MESAKSGIRWIPGINILWEIKIKRGIIFGQKDCGRRVVRWDPSPFYSLYIHQPFGCTRVT